MGENKVKYYFFLGIGGIGMSALARFLKLMGNNVLGFDAVASGLTRNLENSGIQIFYEDNPQLIPSHLAPDNTLVILTPAIKSGELLNYFQSHGFRIIKRAELLGKIANQHPLIAIAGTHGKTSTTALVSHILYGAGLLKAGFVGGVVKNYKSNLIIPDIPPENGFVVVEADEYDRSFLQLHPDITVITSVEADHLDIYNGYEDIRATFEEFIKGAKPYSSVILNEKISLTIPDNISKYYYGTSSNSHFFATDIKLKEQKQFFTLQLKNYAIDTYILFPGHAYIENTVAAAAATYLAGADPVVIARQIQTYLGTERRFDLRYCSNDRCIYDDYAHHPSEIKALYNSIREFYPDKKITIVFQPHLFSRTRDFAWDFAKALDLFDEQIITDIYPAREKPIANVTPYTILDKMKSKNKRYIPLNELTGYLSQDDFQVLLIVGAGDINKIIDPLIRKLNKA